MKKNKKNRKINNKLVKGIQFTVIERWILIGSFFITLITSIIIPLYTQITAVPKYSFTLNNPVGWTKNDDVFSIYNYSDTDMENIHVKIRSYMILSASSHDDYFNDYMSHESKAIPMEAFDMKFQMTGKAKGKIGHVRMNTENNPFSNYYKYNNVEFGPDLADTVSWKITEKDLYSKVKDVNTSYDKMNFVVFSIFTNNEGNIEVYATDYSSNYATGESKTKRVNTEAYFEKFDNIFSYDYGTYYTKEDFENFWNDKDIIETYYYKFIDEIINDSLSINDRYDY